MLAVGPTAWAADHGDGTAGAMFDQTADINDLYTWMSADGTKINLVMTVRPSADATTTFSDAVQYNFRLASYPDYIGTLGLTGAPTDPAKRVRVTCTFATDQTLSCWVVDGTTTVDYVTGDASDPTAPIVSASGKTKVFAGLRNDPFFFNLVGFRRATDLVYQAASTGGLPTPDAAGCYTLPGGVVNALIGSLMSGCGDTPDPTQNPAFDFFAPVDQANNAACPTDDPYFVNQKNSGNVLAIVVQIDKSFVVDDTNSIMAAWASTNM